MRDNIKVFTLASVALLGCRAVLGIEEIEETSDAGTGTNDAAADSVAIDSPIGDGAVADTNEACPPGPGCNVCCREPFKGTPTLPELEKIAKAAQCICGDAGACSTECSTICSGPGMPDPTCIQCLDAVLIGKAKPECQKALQDCANNVTCKPVGECLKTCK